MGQAERIGRRPRGHAVREGTGVASRRLAIQERRVSGQKHRLARLARVAARGTLKTIMPVYRRSSRLIANVAVVGVSLLAISLSRDQSSAWALCLAVVVAGCVIHYGYFISSQSCSRCGEPFANIPYAGISAWVSLLFVFCIVPRHCESCGNDAEW